MCWEFFFSSGNVLYGVPVFFKGICEVLCHKLRFVWVCMDVNHLPEVSDLSKKSWGGIEGDREFFVWDVRRGFFFVFFEFTHLLTKKNRRAAKELKTCRAYH